MVGVPLAVAAGETLPHCAELQETVQVTPLPDESWPTVAVTDVDPVAISEVELAETKTAIGGGTTMGGELPPQLTMIVTEDKPRSELANHAVRFICASASAILAMAVTARPPLGR